MKSSNTLPYHLRDGRQAPVVLVGLDCYTGLQMARVFRRNGVPVIGTAENARHFACRTRHCQQLVEAPARTEGLIEVLEELGQQFSAPAVLLPCIDMSVLLISQFRARLERYYRMALPPHSLLAALADKSSFHRLAIDHGFLVPRTISIHNRQDALRAAKKLNFPCVLKPDLKTEHWERIIKTKIFEIHSSQELIDTYDRCGRIVPGLIAQEWIEGDDNQLFTCNGYFDKHSRPLVTFVSRKLRQWPPGTGIGSLGQECRNDEILDLTVRLFQQVQFQGLGYLEAKYNQRDRKYYLIEANVGRPTGRSSTAEAAGVQLHYTMYCDLLDLPLPEARQQKYRGMKWIHWRRDLQAAFHQLRRGKMSLLDWWRSVRGPKTSAVFSWTDPLPCLGDLWSAGKKIRPGWSPRSVPVLPLDSVRIQNIDELRKPA